MKVMLSTFEHLKSFYEKRLIYLAQYNIMGVGAS